MFIYKYMAGLADSTPGGEDDDGYDPHLHRRVEKPTTYADTMIHLLKGSVGAGILAMPAAVGRLGALYGAAGIALVGAFATYCIHLLIWAQYYLCKKWKRGYMAYPRSMRTAVAGGPRALRWAAAPLYHLVGGVLVAWQLGLCCVYFIFVAENIKQVCDYHALRYSLQFHIAWQLGPQLILNFIKNLKLLTPLSTISNTVMLLGLLLVYFYMIEDDPVIEEDTFQIKRLEEIPTFIGTTLFALEGVGVILAIEYNMDQPKHFVGCCGLFNIGMCVIVVMYTFTGVCGYLKYADDVLASVTLNLPRSDKKAQAAKVMIAVAIFLSVPLQNFVAYSIIYRKLKKMKHGYGQNVADYLLRIILVIIPWAAALAMPFLGPFIALFGALCLSLLSVVFPALMDACVWYPDRYGPCRYKLLRDLLIIGIGLFCLASGCYTSINDIIDAI